MIRGGIAGSSTVAYAADVAIRDEIIAAVGLDLLAGRNQVDASGLLVLPGGLDSHSHIEQVSAGGLLNADTFETASAAAAFGNDDGDLFRRSAPENDLREVVRDYQIRAARGAMVDSRST